HLMSRRHHGPFVAVECATLTSGLLKHTLGARASQAGASAKRHQQGTCERAPRTTLFLYSIHTLSQDAQKALLQVLRAHPRQHRGRATDCLVDVAVVMATTEQLAGLVAQGTFQRALWEQLAGMALTVPPLRERREDIPRFVSHFLATATVVHGRQITG